MIFQALCATYIVFAVTAIVTFTGAFIRREARLKINP